MTKSENFSKETKQTVVKTDSFSNDAVKADKKNLAFSQVHYNILFVALAFIAIGLFIMTLDKEPFGFGFLGLTLGPIILFIGFMIPFVAILKKK